LIPAIDGILTVVFAGLRVFVGVPTDRGPVETAILGREERLSAVLVDDLRALVGDPVVQQLRDGV